MYIVFLFPLCRNASRVSSVLLCAKTKKKGTLHGSVGTAPIYVGTAQMGTAPGTWHPAPRIRLTLYPVT